MIEFFDLAYVHSTPEDTFRLLADARAFVAHSRAFRYEGAQGGPFAVEGDRFDVDWLLLVVPVELKFEVRSCVPPERLVLEARGRGVSLDYDFTLRASGPGTRIHMASRMKLSLWYRVLTPMLRSRFGADGSALLSHWQRTLNEQFRLQRLRIHRASTQSPVASF